MPDIDNPSSPLFDTTWNQETISSGIRPMAMDHKFSQNLMQAAVNRVDPLPRMYQTISETDPKELEGSFGLVGGDIFYHELGSPSALYNWELGIHVIMLAVDRSYAIQQFDELYRLQDMTSV